MRKSLRKIIKKANLLRRYWLFLSVVGLFLINHFVPLFATQGILANEVDTITQKVKQAVEQQGDPTIDIKKAKDNFATNNSTVNIQYLYPVSPQIDNNEDKRGFALSEHNDNEIILKFSRDRIGNGDNLFEFEYLSFAVDNSNPAYKSIITENANKICNVNNECTFKIKNTKENPFVSPGRKTIFRIREVGGEWTHYKSYATLQNISPEEISYQKYLNLINGSGDQGIFSDMSSNKSLCGFIIYDIEGPILDKSSIDLQDNLLIIHYPKDIETGIKKLSIKNYSWKKKDDPVLIELPVDSTQYPYTITIPVSYSPEFHHFDLIAEDFADDLSNDVNGNLTQKRFELEVYPPTQSLQPPTNTLNKFSRLGDLDATQPNKRLIDIKFTESLSTIAVNEYILEYMIYDLKNHNARPFQKVLKEGSLDNCSLHDTVVDQCTYTIGDVPVNSAILYRIKAKNYEDQSEWTNWNNINSDSSGQIFSNTVKNLLDNDGVSVYDAWQNSVGAFSQVHGYSNSEGGVLIVENEKPTTILSGVEEVSSSSYTVEYDIIDEHSNAKSLTLTLYKNGTLVSSITHNQEDLPSGNADFNLTSSGYGTYCIKAQAEDIADDGELDNGRGNIENLPNNCDLEFIYTNENLPPIITTSGVNYLVSEGEDITTPEYEIIVTDDQGLEQLCVIVLNMDSNVETLNRCISISGTTHTTTFGEMMNVTKMDTSKYYEGNYRISLIAEDNHGLSTSEVNIDMNIENVTPSLSFNIEEEQYYINEYVNLVNITFDDPSFIDYDGDGISDNENGPDDAIWDISVKYPDRTDWQNIIFTNRPVRNETYQDHSFAEPGLYEIQLRVCESNTAPGDGQCTIVEDTIQIISPEHHDPILSDYPEIVTELDEGETLSLPITAEDEDGDLSKLVLSIESQYDESLNPWLDNSTYVLEFDETDLYTTTIGEILGMEFVDTSLMYEGSYMFNIWAFDSEERYDYLLSFIIVNNVVPEITEVNAPAKVTVGSTEDLSFTFTDPSIEGEGADDALWTARLIIDSTEWVRYKNISTPGEISILNVDFDSLGIHELKFEICEEDSLYPSGLVKGEGKCDSEIVIVKVVEEPVEEAPEFVEIPEGTENNPLIINEGEELDHIIRVTDANGDFAELCLSVLDQNGDELNPPMNICSTNADTTLEDLLEMERMYTSEIDEGNYIFRFTASDELNNVTVEDVFVAINNVPPTVDLSATPTIVRIGEEIIFSASFEDPSSYINPNNPDSNPDDSNWSYTINYGDSTITDDTTSNPGNLNISNHSYHDAGEYTVTLEVCEESIYPGEGKCSTATIDITVEEEPSNTMPEFTSILSNPITLYEGQILDQNIRVVDTDGDLRLLTLYLYHEDTGKIYEFAKNIPASEAYAAEYTLGELVELTHLDTMIWEEGRWYITYVAYDDHYFTMIGINDAGDDFTHRIDVNNVPPVPSLSASATTINENQTVDFSGSFTDPSIVGIGADDANWYYTMNFGDGNKYSRNSIARPGRIYIPSHTYTQDGTHTATLTVCEARESSNSMSENECRSTSLRITVKNTYVPPKPKPPAQGNNNDDDVAGTEIDLLNQTCEEKYFTYGYVYNDLDEDRSKDEKEDGANNVEVNVFVMVDEEGVETEYKIQKLTTDSDGRWEMQLCEGNYEFKINEETLPTGANLIDDSTQTVTVNQDLEEAVNFRYIIDESFDKIVNQICPDNEKNTLSGFVYNDKNNNSEKDEDESVAEGVEITIYYEYEGEEYEITTVTSDEEGYFEVNLCEAEYIARVDEDTLPDGAVLNTSEFEVDMTQDEVELSFIYTESEGIINFLRNNCLWIILAVVAIVVVFLIGAAILRGVGAEDEQEEF